MLAGDLVFERVDVVDAAEKAAVRQAIVDLVENRTYGDGFSVRVRGLEIKRNWTRFTADIFRGGLKVGETVRTLEWSGPTLFVRHNTLKIFDKKLRRHGFGTDWNAHLERWYRASGVDHIRIRTSLDGNYVWARLGFRWVLEGEARGFLSRLARLLEDPDVTPSEVAAARELLDRAARYPWGDKRFPTVRQVADLGRGEPRPSGAHEHHLGRRVLNSGWDGQKDLR